MIEVGDTWITYLLLIFSRVSVGWGQGLCGERLPDHRDSSSAIASDGATKRRHDALRDSELVETQSLCSPSTCSGNGNSSHSGQPLPLPRFLRGARLRLTSVACGSGHVIAAVSGGAVISWGSGALGPSNDLGEQQVRGRIEPEGRFNGIHVSSLIPSPYYLHLCTYADSPSHFLLQHYCMLYTWHHNNIGKYNDCHY